MEIKNGYIRVTELLKPWQNFATIPQDVLEAKAEIGTNVHEAIAAHSIGLPLPLLTEREKKYFDSYLKWEEGEEPTYLCTEQRYYNEDYMVTGQIDAIVTFPGRSQGRILDFKTSSKESPLHWAIQAGWYYLLAKNNKIEVADTAHMLQLKDNGAPAKLYTYAITPHIINTCMALYNSYVYFHPIKPECDWCC